MIARRVTRRPYTCERRSSSALRMRLESPVRPMTGFRSRLSVAPMTTTLHRIQDERLAGALALLIAAAALALANFGSSDNGGAGAYAVCVGVCAVLVAVLFGRVLPQAADPARAAWILAALALAACVVFWSGLPFVLGMGAVYSGGRAGRTAPVALGALAIVLAIVACVIG